MAHARRKFSVKLGSPPNSDINITPLVDVVLVLLIIFMVVTPLLEKDIEVRVPEQEQVQNQDEVPQGQVVVQLDEQGALSINTEKIAEADYVERLTKMMNAKAKGDKVVFFIAEEKTNYGKLVAALDGARKAGAETLGMATEKFEQQQPAPEAPPAPDAPPAP